MDAKLKELNGDFTNPVFKTADIAAGGRIPQSVQPILESLN